MLFSISLVAEEIFQALNEKKITDHERTKTVDWYKKLLVDDPLILDREYIGETNR